MRHAHLGDIETTRQGLGCLGLSELRGETDDAQSARTIAAALDAGVRLLSTADSYRAGHNESLIGDTLTRLGEKDARVVTKVGIRRDRSTAEQIASGTFALDGSPEYIAHACRASLRRLKREVIDVYVLHRVDPEVPVEESVGAMGQLVDEGLVRGIGLSEVSASTLRRAHSVHPLVAVESEWSLWSRAIEDDVLPACRELSIGVLAFAPLGRGFLAGAVSATHRFEPGDGRAFAPWFREENLAANASQAERFAEIASGLGCSPSQLALAWLHAQGDDVVPIPGTRREANVRQNASAMSIALDTEVLSLIENAIRPDTVHGSRYADMSTTAPRSTERVSDEAG